MDFNVPTYGFLYGDYEYFAWFQCKTEGTLQAVLTWKGLHRFRDGPIARIRNGTIWDGRRLVVAAFDDFPLITRIFLHHLESPLEFPILDRYVWAAMRRMEPESQLSRLPKSPTDWDKHYCACYMPFFATLYKKHSAAVACVPNIESIDAEIIRRRVLDRALWTFGKILG